MASVIEREEFSQAKAAKHDPADAEVVWGSVIDGAERAVNTSVSAVDDVEQSKGIAVESADLSAIGSAVDQDPYDPSAIIDWYRASALGEPPPWGEGDPEQYALDDAKRRFVAFRDFFLAALLPIHAGNLELAWVPTELAEQNKGLVMEWESRFADIPKVTMRIIRWQTNEKSGQPEITDLIEQEIFTPVKEIDSFVRFRALFEGWALALHECFVWEAKQKERVYAYPFECFSGAVINAYDLKKAQTRNDFYAAMKAKRRLGRLFGV